MTKATESTAVIPHARRQSAGTPNSPPSAVALASDEPVLLGGAEIEFELRRLIRRLIEGSRLLHGVRSRQPDAEGRRPSPDQRPGVLLDLEVNGVRCLLTWRLNSAGGAVSRLTMREREVANMVALGLTNSAIAANLDVSPWTVSTHLRRIFAKLNVPTRAAMVAVIADAVGTAAAPAEPDDAAGQATG